MPVIVELFKEHRSEAFVRKERYVWRAMPRQDQRKGFSKLPRRIKNCATDVALFYLMIAYLSEYEISDSELLALQVQYRLLKIWQTIEPYVKRERIMRGGEYTFLNTLEVFVERVRMLDSDAIAHRMFSRVNGTSNKKASSAQKKTVIDQQADHNGIRFRRIGAGRGSGATPGGRW